MINKNIDVIIRSLLGEMKFDVNLKILYGFGTYRPTNIV